ncbi:MAG: class I SAM-dependent methyltransferase [Kiloniellales bacterium]
MPLDRAEWSRLEAVIETRSRRRGLSADLARLRYANRYVYPEADTGRPRRVLYVGVGHGLDALLALIDGLVERVVGVDPYLATHGNDDEDYRALTDLLEEFGLNARFTVHRGLIQDYRCDGEEAPDRIVINDVLHHIFETAEPLRECAMFPDAVALFGRLRALSAPDARLVLGDVSRHGLRPLAGRLGLFHRAVDYTTKQDWCEWDAAVLEGGWRRLGLVDYVPYALAPWRTALRGWPARYSLCEKYFLTYGA